ncbi:zinc ABC transporter substrate-binding protein [Ruegeria sp. Ofav3-42]|uniref:zinc ABC transporter substrate-binding protein n=1 Tax=Ruegeria sp. Ofav3-42 TaxID=2917759 RepID=UPI001EF5FE21|nr:zinc ABC transporter substrate-binding protein [Ruegeria sp. Ofav3-42]MCG7519888.1 zinc ABC transporter substrate-binding protein [Ruegeria sp. Ofav3-42]
MSRKLLPVSIIAALMGGTAMADVPNVAVDIAPVHSLVARVMEGVGTPDLIVQPGGSPHEYNLRPSEAAALQEANLVFWIGEDLTPWMEGAIETLADGATVTSLLESDGTVLLDFRESALFEAHDHGDEDDHGHEEHTEDKDHDDHGHDDHADEAGHDDHDHDGEHGHEDHGEDKDHDDHDHGDEHAEGDDHGHEDEHGHDEHAEGDDHDHEEHAGHDDHHDHAHGEHDPHAWLSPENANAWLNVIAAQLSAADPDNAGTYFANAAAAREEMAALSAEVNETLKPVRGSSFIVFHDAYQYFENAFDFPASGAISIGDASDPSPARVAEIQGRIRDEGIDCVLAEPQFNPGLVETVMDGTEAKTNVIDPLGAELEPGTALYPEVIRNMAKTLAECL